MQNKKQLIAIGKPGGYFHNLERGDLYLKTPNMRASENYPLISTYADKLLSSIVINCLIKKD